MTRWRFVWEARGALLPQVVADIAVGFVLAIVTGNRMGVLAVLLIVGVALVHAVLRHLADSIDPSRR